MKRKLQISIAALFFVFAVLFIIASPLTVSTLQLSMLQLLIIAILIGAFFSIIATLLITLTVSLPFEEFYEFIESSSKKSELPESLPMHSAPELHQVYNSLREVSQKIQRQIPGVENSIAYGDVRYRLLTTITHRLRTPITGLKWALSELESKKSKMDDEDRMLLEGAVASVKTIGGIVEILVKATQEKTEFHTLKKEPVAIIELIQDIIDETSLLAKSKKIRIHVQQVGGNVPTILGDKMELELALQNLIANAIHYSPNGRAITIIVGHEKSQVLVKIMDKGIGIGKDEIPTLFSLFNRGKQAIVMNTEGTGLGLNLSKSIITNHGGDVTIESEKDKGTTVTVLLPVKGKGELETFIEH